MDTDISHAVEERLAALEERVEKLEGGPVADEESDSESESESESIVEVPSGYRSGRSRSSRTSMISEGSEGSE